MEAGIILDANDIKKILAQHYGVEESKVIKSQYSYTIVGVKLREAEAQDEEERVKSEVREYIS